MKIDKVRTYMMAMSLLLGACRFLTPEASATPAPTITAKPVATRTATPRPTETATATSVPPTATATEIPVSPTAEGGFALALPSGAPADSWKGVPIMPGALNGEDEGASYAFTTEASPEEVQAFYQQSLEGAGWDLLGAGEGGDGNLLMIFSKGLETLSVGIFEVEELGLTYVLIA